MKTFLSAIGALVLGAVCAFVLFYVVYRLMFSDLPF